MWKIVLAVVAALVIGLGGGWLAHIYISENSTWFSSPLIGEKPPTPKPHLAFTIPALTQRQAELDQRVQTQVDVEDLARVKLLETPLEDGKAEFITVPFSFQTLGGAMTGVINIPPMEKQLAIVTEKKEHPTIVLLRGYVPKESYQPGVGTKNAAAAFARQGYVTVAPDFLGYGGSDLDPSDSWEARFIKPAQVAELITSLEKYGIEGISTGKCYRPDCAGPMPQGTATPKVGIWAHSNGGQIALSTLEILQRSIPTTLWAPVTAPFPYSILYFGDEEVDEGKSQRAWISLFEQKYDAAEFSHTTYLNQLQGPIQIHHGMNDDAALVWWSREFADKVESENQRRITLGTHQATMSAVLAPALPPIDLKLFIYPNANHNLQPGWDTAISRDLEFFQTNLITH